jgi:hypothetical protein
MKIRLKIIETKIVEHDFSLPSNTPVEKVLFENYKGWGERLDQFRQTEIFKQSNGKDLENLFYEWINMYLYV